MLSADIGDGGLATGADEIGFAAESRVGDAAMAACPRFSNRNASKVCGEGHSVLSLDMGFIANANCVCAGIGVPSESVKGFRAFRMTETTRTG